LRVSRLSFLKKIFPCELTPVWYISGCFDMLKQWRN
jgi:hypothetical protein